MEHHEEHHITPLRVYFAVFGALLLLLVATVLVYVFETALGAFAIPVAIAIAVVKALLIILYFMHVVYSPKLIWLTAGIAFFFLGIMLTLTLQDYVSRDWLRIMGK